MAEHRRERFKDVERGVAKLLNGERIPVTGRYKGYVPDIRHEQMSIEVKSYARLPALLKKAYDQAQEAGKKEGKLPVSVLHQKGQPYKDAFIFFRIRDLVGEEEDGGAN